MKLFLDANVLFTAAYSPEGISRGLFALAEEGNCRLLTSPFALEEAHRNLALKAPTKVAALERLATLLAIVPEPSPEQICRATELPLPAKDAPIMAAATAAGADLLVTGDRRDFGHLFGRTIEGVRVMSPRETLALLLEEME